jgi:prepilin-type N-terminal cleavage/methylation domain-containing protein
MRTLFSPFLNSRYGFTLVELLVVISVGAVLSAVGFASYMRYSASQAVTQAARDVKLAIERAKFNATSTVKPPACTNNDPLNSYSFQVCAISGTCSTDPAYNNPDYEVDYNCGSTIDVYNSLAKKLGSVTVDTGVTTCSIITFTPLSHGVTGVPCTIRLTGARGASEILSVDTNGNVLVP